MIDDQELRTAIDDALRPGRFLVAPGWRVRIEHAPHETIAWEIFRGHLLDGAKTRERKTFSSWHVFLEPPAGANDSLASPPIASLVSLKYDAAERRLFVTRNILIHAWEAYESAPGVIDSHPVQKWSAELVATLRIDDRRAPGELAREIGHCVFLSVVGNSRLPITSLESPLPAFALGQLTFLADNPFPPPGDITSLAALLSGRVPHSAPLSHPKFLEFVLRAAAPADMPRLAQVFVAHLRERSPAMPHDCSALISLFAGVSFSPFTGLVENLVRLLRELTAPALFGPDAIVPLARRMLRLLTRHLTAYDLVKFHSLGANYPDALALDALLKLFVELAERHPECFLPRSADDVLRLRQKQSSRRALRQAWLLRKRYEGHRVPDAPTSMGENQRVLPEPFQRVADEQIVDPARRRKSLFENEPAESLLLPGADAVWQLCLAELLQPSELRELGIGLFLDRPLGILKADGEVDRTPLLSYVAFSRSVAEARLHDLYRWQCLASENVLRDCVAALQALPILGFPAAELPGTERPGVVALEDARRAANDFVFLATTRASRMDFARAARVTHPSPLAAEFAAWAQGEPPALIIRTASTTEAARGKPFLTAFDSDLRPCWRLGAQTVPGQSPRYDEAFGQEFLTDGLFVEKM